MKSARYRLASLASGLLFGFGLALSGMTRPLKVLGFLDVAGHWDPSLIFVLGGAVVVATIGFRLARRRASPLFAASFELPAKRAIDKPLLGGALLFGIGWGIAGYCPGPAIAQLAAPNVETLYFLPAMVAGWWLYRLTSGAAKAPQRSGQAQ
ncbi:YeeE/YedE family protein [Paraburkholderia caballeronis]|uniref:Sulphur transport domain-containing protein n=1 Tax=Paraburkholderia caballeronis TaxID=416943 RepID=A0A1H7V8G2_9BURK|nr:YeeE/YedE family protein [Paraburkholderia caballeronis]PXW16475.1 hypothetical protein C7403_12248 [Paraburkholderia caballeronis]PXW94248.1 hypothetical protein C7407_12229 [Paraburkholderia caballeronis]RAJ89725.1 hypothetical protein C7409_12248 [Paraburkholderia caballeronis]TDV09208.1 hypothetical protein C7408_11629 [Paraburkholderia caballeronis]TDV12268.1 hypothetical protein C7406_11729 [Paraburkholderia caballeronis]